MIGLGLYACQDAPLTLSPKFFPSSLFQVRHRHHNFHGNWGRWRTPWADGELVYQRFNGSTLSVDLY